MSYGFAFCPIIIACEADSCTSEEQECVGHVLLNRARDGRWRKTPEACGAQRFQFSEFNDDKADNENLCRVLELPTNHPVMQAAARAWDAASATMTSDPTKGATHFFAPAKVVERPKWAAAPAVLTLKTTNLEFWAQVP